MNAGQFQKGGVPWNKCQYISKRCPACEAAFEVKPSLDRVTYCSRSCAKKGKPSPMKGRTTTPEAREKQRLAKLGIRGPDHWNWRGGNRESRKVLMKQDEYVQWRKAVMNRGDFTCQMCGTHGGELHADHILPWASHPELRYDVTNGRVLCVPCHWTTPSFPPQLIPKGVQIGR